MTVRKLHRCNQREYPRQRKNCVAIEVTTFTPEEIQSFADAVRTDVWPKLAQTMGEDFWKNFAADLGVEINF